MKKALFGVAVASCGLIGCHEAYGDPTGTDQEQLGDTENVAEALIQDRSDFNPLDSHLAALATEVLLCKGSFSQNDFFIDDRRVLRRCKGDPRKNEGCLFECTQDQRHLENIDNLLAIQEYDLLNNDQQKDGPANSVPYFAGRWQRFVKQTQNLECPTWTGSPRNPINPPEQGVPAFLECYKRDPTGLSCLNLDKTSNIWQVKLQKACLDSQDPACAARRAVLCSSWAGAQFIVRASALGGRVAPNPQVGQIVTDPKYWKDNTPYGTSPYDPTLGYSHFMAEWGLPPGDSWGAINRHDELCTKWNSTLDVVSIGYLRPVDCDGMGWMCATVCTECDPTVSVCTIAPPPPVEAPPLPGP